MRLAALLFSSARTAKSSAGRAFHCCRHLNVVGSVGEKKAGRCSKGALQRLRPGHVSKVPGGAQRRASSIGSVCWPCVLSFCQCDLASSQWSSKAKTCSTRSVSASWALTGRGLRRARVA
eukprot:9391073-Pyramimonas_sp.AAC.1